VTGTELRRRAVLAGVGTGVASVGGCLSVADSGQSGGGDGPPDREEPTDTDHEPGGSPDRSDDCGPASLPLSEQVTADPGEFGSCDEGRRPSFAIENDRNEPIAVAVTLTAGDDRVADFEYDLSPGERAVEWSVASVAELAGVTVEVDGEASLSGEWPEPSCRRHAVAVVRYSPSRNRNTVGVTVASAASPASRSVRTASSGASASTASTTALPSRSVSPSRNEAVRSRTVPASNGDCS